MAERDTGTGSATIFDVAREAGVSTATVSRVANGHTNIKPATRARVEEAMERLGYVANLRARGLAGGRTSVIGLLVDNLESSYIAQVVRGIDRSVSEHGYDVMLATMHARRSEKQYIHHLFNGLVDGLIVLLTAGFEPYLEEVAIREIPVVLIDHAPTDSAPVVKSANGAGAVSAVEHLAELGHRRIGFITGFLDVASAQERLAAYRDAVADRGLDADPELVYVGDFNVESGAEAARQLLGSERPPTAILASSDAEAFGVIRVAQELGYRIPDDLSVVGFDDIPEASYLSPGLTTVSQHMTAMGSTAADILMDALSDTPRAVATVELPTELIVRGTTAAPRSPG